MTGSANNDEALRSKLEEYGLSGASIRLIRYKDGVTVARVGLGDASYILKTFDDDDFAREIDNYRILASLGVPTLKLFGSRPRSILMEDISCSPVLRLGTNEDMNDPAVAAALAVWYRTLHERGEAYVRDHGSGMYDEWDMFTIENVLLISERLPECAEAVRRLTDSFSSIRARMDAVPRTLCYNDFYYTNLAVKKDKSFAMMFDYNLLGKGCYANDILNVTYDMTPDIAALFLKEYGRYDEGLIELARRISPVISLVSAIKRGIFPDWAEEEKEVFIKDWIE